MDYDKLVKGRRRNWDALKPDELRKAERDAERAERQEQRDAEGKTGYFERRAARMEKEDVADKEEFRKRLKISGYWVAGFFLLVFGVIGIERVVEAVKKESYADELSRLQTDVANRRAVNDLTNPVRALATWQSAWTKGDMRLVASLHSVRAMEAVKRDRSVEAVISDFRRMFDMGALKPTVQLVSLFSGAEIVSVPGRPWRNEQLAIFRSPEVVMVGAAGLPKRYIVAFSFHAGTKTWRFADVREESQFSIRWTQEAQISPFRGSGAQKFDSAGLPIGAE